MRAGINAPMQMSMHHDRMRVYTNACMQISMHRDTYRQKIRADINAS